MLLIGSLVGAFWFLAFVTAQVVIFAARPIRNRSAVIMLLFGCAVAAALLSAMLVPADLLAGITTRSHRLLAVVAAVAVMVSAFILYMPFYYTIVTSLSVQTIVLIHEAPDHRLPLGTVASPTVYDQIVRGRLASMVQAGNLTRHGLRYVATAKGQRIGRVFAALKDLWKLGPGG